MEELIRRHAGEFDEAYQLIHTVDLVKSGTTYRIEIHQKMTAGYRKQFIARYFRKTSKKPDSLMSAEHEDEANGNSNELRYWISLPGVSAVADSARDALNQALIWLGVYTKKSNNDAC